MAPASPSPDERAPASVKWLGGGVIVVLLAIASYLMAVRGEALLLDLQSLSRYIGCY